MNLHGDEPVILLPWCDGIVRRHVDCVAMTTTDTAISKHDDTWYLLGSNLDITQDLNTPRKGDWPHFHSPARIYTILVVTSAYRKKKQLQSRGEGEGFG
jgi:hypothetical protein